MYLQAFIAASNSWDNMHFMFRELRSQHIYLFCRDVMVLYQVGMVFKSRGIKKCVVKYSRHHQHHSYIVLSVQSFCTSNPACKYMKQATVVYANQKILGSNPLCNEFIHNLLITNDYCLDMSFSF